MQRNRAADYGHTVLLDVFQSAGVALGLLDADGTLLHANSVWDKNDDKRQIPRLLQVAPGVNCIGELSTLAREGDPRAAQLLEGFERALGGAVYVVRCEWFEAQPEPRWFDLTISSLKKSRMAVVSSLDVSRCRRAAASTASQIDKLARTTRLSSMSLLAAAAGHELNQPLLAVVANAETALLELRGTSERAEQLREQITEITHSATRASEIIQRMRRLLSGSVVERIELDLNQLVREVLELLASDALRQHVRVEYSLDSTNPTVYGDPIQLQQVIINLLTNAMEATVNAAPAERSIQVVTARRGRNVEICVNDHGPALDPKALGRMFEPLYTTKRNGAGLGLYITRAIVESHGGIINAQRITDHGLSMRVTLPARTHSSLDQILTSVNT